MRTLKNYLANGGDINQLARTVHAIHRQWWLDIETGEPIQRNKGELLALVHSELTEAHDGIGMMDDHLPQFPMTVVELADTAIRLLDYCGGFHYTLKQAPEPDASYANEIAILAMHKNVSHILELERKSKPGAEEGIFKLLMTLDRISTEMDYGIMDIMDAKLDYNSRRKDHKHEHRKEEGGKKF